ncbi:MAG: SRPBCC family protein [Acidobacteria bacterium]|nr:SRPBCC family protein [Acidobacteriota bacterium]
MIETRPDFVVTATGDREIVMTRSFAAPRELVFEAFTKPELLKRWLLGPPGWTMPVCEVDLRVGGRYRYVWEKDGEEMGMGGVFREIVAPERIVNTEQFDNPWYEGEATGTVTFVEENGRTTVSQRLTYASKDVRDKILESGMERGVEASYDRLAQLLASD